MHARHRLSAMFATPTEQSLRLLHAVHFSLALVVLCVLLLQLGAATAPVRTVISDSGSDEILFRMLALSDPRRALFSREIGPSCGFVDPAWEWLGEAGSHSVFLHIAQKVPAV